MLITKIKNHLAWRLDRLGRASVERGVPPAWLGYRWVRRETVPAYFARHEERPEAGRYETVHPEAVARHPLPQNVPSREDLPDDRGWWGYSFRDVPARTSGETFIATLPDVRVAWYHDPEQNDDFYPAFLTHDRRALDLREVRFRPRHAQVLRRSGPPVRVEKATWILERVYHNHSHWLTAHLPKLLLLKERGLLGNVLLPPWRTSTLDGSLRMLGLDPGTFRTFDPARPLDVGELTVLGTDRFRPELLRTVRAAYAVPEGRPPHRKVYISRAKATRRRLVNEDAVWALLEEAGFEQVFMEDLGFEEQVRLMQETDVLVAPHGAGLTNMVFCPEGTRVAEIADLSFPNPNFYAIASAMGHRYWLLSAEALGDRHPLERDLRIDVAAVEDVLPQLSAVSLQHSARFPKADSP